MVDHFFLEGLPESPKLMAGTVVGDGLVYTWSEQKKRPPPAPACISKHLPTAYGG